jgi:simple sugar transport system substrate-binding protein
MSENDVVGDAIERLEWSDKKSDEPVSKIAQLTRRTALTGGAAGLAAVLLEACGSSGNSGTTNANAATSSNPIPSIFGVQGGYHFSMVNHVTTNDFFTPTQSGAADACKLLHCSYQWGGSETSSVSQMVNVINSAISAKVDGIATTLIDPTAFNKPVASALAAGIPVVAYNADAPTNTRLAYIGQDLFASGQQVGEHIKALIPGGGDVAVFIATPGSSNLQPRLDGIQAELKGSNINVHTSASGAAESQELSTIQAFVSSHSTYKGFFAVDAGSTEAVAQAIKKNGLKGKVAGGGYDLTPTTEALLAAEYIDFTIDQQPYLQGFLPILELFFYKASQGLTGPADVDTGLKFLDSKTVVPYSSTKSEYEGTGTKPGVQKA